MKAKKRVRADLVGRQFGRLRVTSFYRLVKRSAHWRCLCSCGTSTVVAGNHLLSGHTQSCSCLKQELLADPALGSKLAAAREAARPKPSKPRKPRYPVRTELIGQRFGKLTILALSKKTDSGRRRFWSVQCDCGKKKEVLQQNLLNGRTVSCGCVNKTYGRTHGQSRSNGGRATPTYQSFRGMTQRCSDPNHIAYANYGALGVTVCARWQGEHGFQNFLSDMGERRNGTSIDRINPFLGYSSDNCRWATASEQRKNKRASYLREHPELEQELQALQAEREEKQKQAHAELWARGVVPYPARWKQMSDVQRNIWLSVWRTADEDRFRYILHKELEKNLNALFRTAAKQRELARAA